MAMKENSKKVLNYLKGINGADVTAADVAEALGLENKKVAIYDLSGRRLNSTTTGVNVVNGKVTIVR